MQRQITDTLGIVVAMILCVSIGLAEQDKGKTMLLVLSKHTAVDPCKQQERARTAATKVANAAKAFQPDMTVDKIAENILSKKEVLQGVPEKVTGDIFRMKLRSLVRNCSFQDTVIIYTHSHGRRSGFEESQPLGGIVMDLPIRHPEHRGALLWDEYAKLLLKIPARNVMILTMSCFSGGLVEYLNRPNIRIRWNNRKKQGRNFIVMTSQSKDSTSHPILKDGEIINPFTYAVVKAFEGEADGFKLEHGESFKSDSRDGNLTVGEMIDYVIYTTENTHSELAMNSQKHIAKPQVTGSFNRNDILFTRGKAVSNIHKGNN